MMYLILFVFGLILYYLILYPLYLSPLANIPSANPLAPLTSLWIQWQRFHNREVPTFEAAFQSKGPIVRIGPNEVALNTIDAVRTVHGYGPNNYTKPAWYSVFQHLDCLNSFSSLTRDHNVRRHRISSVYTKPFVQGSEHVKNLLSEVLLGRLLPLLDSHAQTGQPVEVLTTGFAYSLDFVSAWLFGFPQGTNFLADTKARDQWLEMYANVYSSPMYWLQEYPKAVSWLSKIGIHIVPKSYFRDCQKFDSWVVPRVQACERRFSEANVWESQGYPVVYAQLRSAMASEQASKSAEKFSPSESQIRELGSECLDHMVATRDTFGVVLSYILLYISRHPAEQNRLREELRLAQQRAQNSGQSFLSATSLEALPFLNAVLKESIRLRGNVPTSNPRIVSASAPVQLGPYKNISGVRVSALAWCLHRNEEIFPDAESWVPDRWMVNPSTKMDATEQDKWFWAFGSGSRRCLGQNLAMEVLRFTVAAIYSEFETHIYDESKFINEDRFVTGKGGERLDLTFKRVASTA
ncbi:Cytochrome P450 [Penicillium macrosclerotiorum]|uniref:Cytochrome P450 n=1 Tax=Penicillium macrosclerotiorum TaxID=303699 RepID=UPI0025477F04|nr:Cytochrome P450 [Penicillium macrosclerotiorum]KAJ5690710.1 Cytochrome P450 [Penicillium macrosclerotiorum]